MGLIRIATVLRFAAAASFAVVAACGGGGGSGGSDSGTLSIALTDGASDDVDVFTVDVDSIELTAHDGAVVSVLAAPVNVDLAQLDDLSQIVNVVDVPRGLYVAASITFDFATANCVLVGQSTPATLLDSSGNPLTGKVTIPLVLKRSPIEALGRRHRVLELDFDLDDSLDVDTSANTVTVDPSLVVRVDRRDPKPLLAYGEVRSVDVSNMIAEVELQTFDRVPLGRATFRFGNGTVGQIDGVPTTGTAAIAALAAEPAGTWIQAYGAADVTTRHLRVAFFETGHGTWNGGDDIVEGHVVARSGGAGSDATLTVLGRSSNASHTTFVFNQAFTVKTSFAATHVVRWGDATAFDTDEFQIGQRVRCFGALSGTTLDATGATAVVREQPTHVLGYANAAPASGALEINVARVDTQDVSVFDWPGGGPTPADPLHFVCDVGDLGDGLDIDAGTPVEARGFFSAFPDAGPDFTATSLTNRAKVASALVIKDKSGGFDVATSTSPTEVQFTITGSAGPGEKATINEGFVDPIDLPTSPTPTVAAAPDSVVFAVRDAVTGSITFELNYAGFTQDIADALAGGRRLKEFRAVGGYDAGSNTTSAVIAGAVIR